jgi:hypothetical protein
LTTLQERLQDFTVRVAGEFNSVRAERGFTWTAPSAQLVWMIPHNLGRYPVVSIRDSVGDVIVADVQHLDENVLTITFSQPTLGSADLS